MTEALKIIGLIACGLVFIRHVCRVFAIPSPGSLLIEGVKKMFHLTDEQLKNCIDWNVHQRNKQYTRSARATTPVNRAEAVRRARHHQRNIERLNDRRRQLDRIN
jgi:hypothetical protein